MVRKLLSLIVPAYNVRREYLAEALASVAAQEGIDHRDMEVAVNDDGSSPEYARALDEVVRAFRTQYPIIGVTVTRSRENRGEAASRNAAIRASTGAYVGLLDADDVLLPPAAAEACAALDRSGASLVFSDYEKVDEAMHSVLYTRQKGDLFAHHCAAKGTGDDPLLHTNFVIHFTALRCEAAEDIGGFQEEVALGTDFDFMIRLARSSPEVNIAHIPQCLYRYRDTQGLSTVAGMRPAIETLLLRHAQETGMNVDAVRYRGKVWPVGSRFYDHYRGRSRVEVSWLDGDRVTPAAGASMLRN